MTRETLADETPAFLATWLANPNRQPQEVVFPDTRLDLGIGFTFPHLAQWQSQ